MSSLKCIALLLFAAACYGQINVATSKPAFLVFDGTIYQGKPDLTGYGLSPVTIIYTSSIWTKGSDMATVPDTNIVRSLAKQASISNSIVVLDIEHWPLVGDPSTVTESIQKYRKTMQLFKQAVPSLKVGYYGVAPIRNYWDAIRGSSSPKYQAWQNNNDNVASIAELADVLFPSVYTFYEDQNGWRKYALAQIQEARRIAHGKPVYVFLWPQFTGARGTTGSYLSSTYWRMELETARQSADGIVIWGGFQQTWDNDAPWWLETQKFLKETQTQR